jgi:hypothetical protein
VAPTDDDKQRALQRAEEMEENLLLIQQDERATVQLLERLDKLAADLFAHAQEWDPVNPETASRVRQQEQQIHLLRAKVERLAELEADEASTIMAEIHKALRLYRGVDS